MQIDDVSVSVGDQVCDAYLGMGTIDSFTPTGCKVKFSNGDTHAFYMEAFSLA